MAEIALLSELSNPGKVGGTLGTPHSSLVNRHLSGIETAGAFDLSIERHHIGPQQAPAPGDGPFLEDLKILEVCWTSGGVFLDARVPKKTYLFKAMGCFVCGFFLALRV